MTRISLNTSAGTLDSFEVPNNHMESPAWLLAQKLMSDWTTLNDGDTISIVAE